MDLFGGRLNPSVGHHAGTNVLSIKERAALIVQKEFQKIEREKKRRRRRIIMESIGAEASSQTQKTMVTKNGNTNGNDNANPSKDINKAGASVFAQVSAAAAVSDSEDSDSDNATQAQVNMKKLSDIEEACQQSVAQDGFVPVGNASTDSNVQIATICRLLGFYQGSMVIRPITCHDKQPGSVRTRTCRGIQYITQAPAVLGTMLESGLPVQEAVTSTPEQPSINDHSGPEGYPKPVSSSSLNDTNVRTFANDIIYVGRSDIKNAGFGIFAARDIVDGEHILLERPLIRTTMMDLFKKFDKLEEHQKAILFSLYRYHPRENADPIEQMFNANAFQTTKCEDVVCPIASNFNHACKPKSNIGYLWDDNRELLVFTAIKDISAHAELLITYGPDPEGLKNRFGFSCTCGTCSTPFSLGTRLSMRWHDFY